MIPAHIIDDGIIVSDSGVDLGLTPVQGFQFLDISGELPQHDTLLAEYTGVGSLDASLMGLVLCHAGENHCRSRRHQQSDRRHPDCSLC